MDKYKDKDFKVYVVWLPMLPTDSRGGWKANRIDDERAVHFWNGDQAVGKWLTANDKAHKHLGDVAWDEYYLFGGDAEWTDTFPEAVSYGTPVFFETERLAKDMATVLDEKYDAKGSGDGK
jgi:hypothetical protein